METQCAECGHTFELEMTEEYQNCPECGFGPETCNHPVEARESEWIMDVDEGQKVERVYCGDCGLPVTGF